MLPFAIVWPWAGYFPHILFPNWQEGEQKS